jgi:reverse gyrase
MDFSGKQMLYHARGEFMSARRQTATVNATARVIQNLAERHHVAYHMTDSDRLAHHISRLAGDDVEFDPIEQMLIGLQRAGRLSRLQMVRLQARYLRETKP